MQDANQTLSLIVFKKKKTLVAPLLFWLSCIRQLPYNRKTNIPYAYKCVMNKLIPSQSQNLYTKFIFP